MSYSELARITGKSVVTVTDYIALMQKGEERLIQGVENGMFTLDFAKQVIESSESDVQHFLMNEFENGNISARDLGCITKILNERTAKGLSNKEMTGTKLKSIIKEKTKKHKMLLAESKIKQNDVIRLIECLQILWADETFVKMTNELKDLPKPELKGKYGN
jgi:ParB family chromosome partitioning protein